MLSIVAAPPYPSEETGRRRRRGMARKKGETLGAEEKPNEQLHDGRERKASPVKERNVSMKLEHT